MSWLTDSVLKYLVVGLGAVVVGGLFQDLVFGGVII